MISVVHFISIDVLIFQHGNDGRVLDHDMKTIQEFVIFLTQKNHNELCYELFCLFICKQYVAEMSWLQSVTEVFVQPLCCLLSPLLWEGYKAPPMKHLLGLDNVTAVK